MAQPAAASAERDQHDQLEVEQAFLDYLVFFAHNEATETPTLSHLTWLTEDFEEPSPRHIKRHRFLTIQASGG